jgi:hypothetical protein
MNKSIIIFFLITFPLFSQNYQSNNRSVLQAGSFSISIENNLVIAFNEIGKNVFREKFVHPSGMISDLDSDGIDEYIIIDSISFKGEPSYKIYIYNTVDSFYLVDSINSGRTSPYFQIDDQTDEMTIVTGNADFDKYNLNPEFFFSPLNCWKYEGSKIFLSNEDMYELLLTENENIMEFIEDYSRDSDSCNFSKKILGAVISAYANYINAGETAIASQFLRKYYLCSDFDQLKRELQKMLGKSD